MSKDNECKFCGNELFEDDDNLDLLICSECLQEGIQILLSELEN